MRSKAKILLARLVAGGSERAELGTWVALAAAWGAMDPRVEDVVHCAIDCCPTPVARHRAVKAARDSGCDIIVSVDNDTLPARGFMEFATDFLLRSKRPSVLACPYVCAGEEQRVQVFRWRTDRTGDPNELARLDHFPREEAAYRTGVEPVACAGTGCYACHTEVFDLIKPPYFRYEFGEPEQVTVIATEDVHCFRDLSAAGVPIYAAWDFWATHWKTVALGKPAVLSPDEVWGRTKKILQERDLHAPEIEPNVSGWFDFPALYDSIIHRCRPGGTVVEVGSYMGLSFVHLAGAARVSGKGIACVSVDHGTGGGEPHLADAVARLGGTTAGHLAKRILAAGLTESVLQIVGTSALASRQFADGSLDAVFLDADHDAAAVERDIRLWWPKLRPGGTMAGHDWDRPSVKEGVGKALSDARQSKLSPSCWEAIKGNEIVTEDDLKAIDALREVAFRSGTAPGEVRRRNAVPATASSVVQEATQASPARKQPARPKKGRKAESAANGRE